MDERQLVWYTLFFIRKTDLIYKNNWLDENKWLDENNWLRLDKI